MAEIIYPNGKPAEITLYELTVRAIAGLAVKNALIRLETDAALEPSKTGLLSSKASQDRGTDE